MTHEELKGRLQHALNIAGNLHTLEDILDAINAGKMQSFAEGDTWCVTQIEQYPRRKVLDIVYVVGDINEVDAGYRRIIDFACAQGCSIIRAYGRIGWSKFLRERGWEPQSILFHKEID